MLVVEVMNTAKRRQSKQCKQCGECKQFIAQCYLHLWCNFVTVVRIIQCVCIGLGATTAAVFLTEVVSFSFLSISLLKKQQIENPHRQMPDKGWQHFSSVMMRRWAQWECVDLWAAQTWPPTLKACSSIRSSLPSCLPRWWCLSLNWFLWGWNT